MPRPRLDPEDKKVNITIRLSQKVIDRMREQPNYSSLVETLLKDYFRKKDSQN